MNSKNSFLVLIVLALCVSVNALAAASGPGELHVLCSNASRPAMSELIPTFEKVSKMKVQAEYANNPILKQRIEAGAEFDVVIIEPQMLTELSKAGFAEEDSVVELAAIGWLWYRERALLL